MGRFVIPASRPLYGWHLAPMKMHESEETGWERVPDDPLRGEGKNRQGVTFGSGDAVEARGRRDQDILGRFAYVAKRANKQVTFGTAERLVQMCWSGPHCSGRPWNVLMYGYGPVLSFVAMTGHAHVKEGDDHWGKMVAQRRTHLAVVDATDLLLKIDWWAPNRQFGAIDTQDMRNVINGLGSENDHEAFNRHRAAAAKFYNAASDVYEEDAQYYALNDRANRERLRARDVAERLLDTAFRDLMARNGHPNLPKTYCYP